MIAAQFSSGRCLFSVTVEEANESEGYGSEK
jgi:hypothetical protein